jgi:gluconolactonase
MKQSAGTNEITKQVTRRDLIKHIGAAAGVAAGITTISPRFAAAQGAAAEGTPPSVITNPPRVFGSDVPSVFPDPDIITIDPMFARYRVGNASLVRLWTGGSWCEGPAWSNQGRYLVWSDIPNNRQMRWLQDDGRVTVFRSPSNNGNGNAFDFQGRQITCEHLTRRVVRYEHDGTITIIADNFGGKHFNSPNDLAPHPDGSIWFTDIAGGTSMYEGTADAAGGPANQNGHLNSRIGQPAEIGTLKRELPMNVYRWDPSGKVEMVTTEDQVPTPNGIAFSPDYKKVYIVSRGGLVSLDVGVGGKLTNLKPFSDMMIDGIRCGTDGIRVDVDGNLWCGSNAGDHLGYGGVTVWSPDGKAIGRIRLPENCANLAFGGPKRNRLFMAASQSLYAVYVNTQGASPG